jgi:SdpI/YhfL family protein
VKPLLPPELLFPLLGVLLIVLGWPLAVRRVRPNRWYGLRVPATFADETVWYDANAVAGRHMVVLGALVAAIALALPHIAGLPPGIYAGVCAGTLGIGSLVLALRGWRVANQLLRQRRGGAGAA